MTRQNLDLTQQQIGIVNDAAAVVDETHRLQFLGVVVDQLLTTLSPSNDKVITAVNTALRAVRTEASSP